MQRAPSKYSGEASAVMSHMKAASTHITLRMLPEVKRRPVPQTPGASAYAGTSSKDSASSSSSKVAAPSRALTPRASFLSSG